MENTEQSAVSEQPVAPTDANLGQDTPIPETAAEGDVETKQEESAPKTFTQAEVDALIQKRLLKEERRTHRRIEQQLRERAEQQQVSVAPERENFKDDESFTQAEIDHRAAVKARELLDERERVKQAEQRTEAFLEKAEKASERYADFHAVVSNPQLPISEAMAEFIAESEEGAEVAYYLGKNPAKAAQIHRMSAVKATVEMTRIAAEIAAKPKATPSNAPDPIKPIGSRGKSTTSALPSDSDSIDDWMRKERERVRSKYR